MYLYEKAGEYPLCTSSGLIKRFSDLQSLDALPELAFSLGGDGTYLETMLIVRNLNIPVAGINTGRLGFLANIPEDEMVPALDMILSGKYDVIERSLLKITNPVDLFGTSGGYALNEITIQKADLNMITINVYMNDVYLNTYWSDGLIISTATGSTAYNLSVGGPILTPEDSSIIISPISPHNLTIRPIVINGRSRLKLIVEGRGKEYLATCDFRSQKLPFTTSLNIEKSEERFKSVMLKENDFFSTLRSKLMWGVDKRN